MSNFLAEYYDALDRLIKNKPNIVPKSAKINNDNVAIEAGRRKGSIKKSRLVYEALIAAIHAAKKEAEKDSDKDKTKYLEARKEICKYKLLWEQALARELSLIHENAELKAQLKKIVKKPKIL